MRRYLLATSGHPNYGDELITSTWLRLLARLHPDDEVVLDSPQAGGSAALHGHLHPRLRSVDTVFRVAEEAGDLDPWQVAAFVRRAVHDHGVAPRWAAGLGLLEGADVVHVLGGGWVNALWPLNVAALAAGAAVAEAGGEAHLTGAGLLPAPVSWAPLLRRLLRAYTTVDVRDRASEALLEGLPQVVRTADDAVLALGADDLTTWAGAPELPGTMLCVQSDVVAPDDLPALAGHVLAQVEAWGTRGDDLGVLECVPRVDRWVWDAVVQPYLPGARFFSLGEVLATGFPAKPGQRWLTTRYHPHLVAAARGAAGVAVDVREDYYGHKHRALLDLGSPFALVRPGVDAPVVDPPPAGWRTQDLVAAKQAVAEAVHGAGPAPAPALPGHPVRPGLLPPSVQGAEQPGRRWGRR